MNPDIVLENQHALLRPMTADDAAEVRKIAFDPEIWRYFLSKIASEEDLAAYMEESLRAHRTGQRTVFTVVDKASGQVAGSTCYANFSARDRRIEVGWSWLGRAFQGTHVNRSCKFLLFRHTFEQESLLRVELKTDFLNVQARQAMKKLGCVEEGVLRSHTLMHDGRRRDTIYYSVLAAEWPGMKARAFADLAAGDAR